MNSANIARASGSRLRRESSREMKMKIKTLAVTGALALGFRAPRRPRPRPSATPSRATSTRSTPTRSTRRFTLGALGNVMEGLTKRDKDLKIIPGLAERWEMRRPDALALPPAQGREVPQRRRLHRRRRGVLRRPRAQPRLADQDARIPADAKVVKVDDHTVDFVLDLAQSRSCTTSGTPGTSSPRSGRRRTAPTQAQSATATSLNSAALNANGTGPFMIDSHEPGVKTVFKPNPNWWGKPEHNLDRGDLHAHQVGRHARRRAAVGRDRHDGPGAGAGHRARQGKPQRRRC